jgi:integrase
VEVSALWICLAKAEEGTNLLSALHECLLEHSAQEQAKIRRGGKIMEHLTRDELVALLKVAKDQSHRNWLLILTAFSHGLRASEALGLKREQIRDGFLSVQRLKGSDKTVQPLVKHQNPLFDEKSALENLVASLPAKARLFPISRMQFWRLMQKYCKLSGIPAHKAHCHVLKYSVAMLSIKEAGIENLRKYLGHKSMGSTGEYLKTSDQEASTAVQSVF